MGIRHMQARLEPLVDVNPILSLRGFSLIHFNHDFIRSIFQIIFSINFQSPFSLLVICSNFQIFKFSSLIFSEFKFWVKDYRIKFYRLSRCNNLRRFLALLVCFPSCPPNNIVWFLNTKLLSLEHPWRPGYIFLKFPQFWA